MIALNVTKILKIFPPPAPKYELLSKAADYQKKTRGILIIPCILKKSGQVRT